MEYAIELDNLTVSFSASHGTVEALHGLSMRVPVGSVMGFLGPNGAGKTTTIHVLLGFTAPTAGGATVLGRDVTATITRERIGYLPEHPQLYGFLTAREHLVMAGHLFNIPSPLLRQRVSETLALVELEDAADRRIGTYSRGMLQRAGLAQALINDPDLVILDEPTGGLDPIGRMSVRRLIADLSKRGKTVFFSSHELSEVELVCDRVALITKGRLAAEGAVSDLVKPGESLERYFLRTVCGDTGDSGTTRHESTTVGKAQ